MNCVSDEPVVIPRGCFHVAVKIFRAVPIVYRFCQVVAPDTINVARNNGLSVLSSFIVESK